MQVEIGKGRLLGCRHHPLVYAHIAKSACTSIKNILYQVDTGRGYEEPTRIHADENALRRVDLDGATQPPADLTTARVRFTFVRDPTRRIYSTFNQKMLHDAPAFREARELWRTKFGATPEASSPDEHRANFLRFLELVRANLAGATPLALNMHWVPQSAMIAFYRSYFSLTDIGRVETFADDMSKIVATAGVAAAPPLDVRFNEGPAPRFSFDETLSAEARQLIGDIYAEDFAEFGYAKP